MCISCDISSARASSTSVNLSPPDYSHWHGTFEVADRWYNEMVPEAREIIEEAKKDTAKKAGAEKVEAVLDEILAAPEHQYTTTGKMPEEEFPSGR